MFKKLLRLIAIILIIIFVIYLIAALVAAIAANTAFAATLSEFFTFGITSAAGAWSFLGVAFASAALAHIVSPEEAKKQMGRVIDGTKFVATSLGSGISGAISGGLVGLLTGSPLLTAAVGVGVFLWLRKGKRDDGPRSKDPGGENAIVQPV